MENERKNIVFSTTVDDSPLELSNTVVDTFEIVQKRMNKIVVKTSSTFRASQALVDSLRPAIENAAKMAKSFSTAIEPMLDTLQKISASLAKTVASISIPTLSEERKQEILDSHRQWGKAGWTWSPNAPLNFYNNPPADINDANARVKHLCTAQSMEKVFNELRKGRINHEDLESAIFCFRNKQYKACALLLFGLIDAKLIRVQPKGERRRPSGEVAVKKLKDQFEDNKNEQMFYTILFCSNLFSCLETIFANGKDFKSEPDVINRNFVDHGMNRKRVRKRDCIQLFLVLNNLLYFLSEDIF